MRCLLLGDDGSDFGRVLDSCAETARMTFDEALRAELSPFDCFCVFGGGKPPDLRLRVKLEAAWKTEGKRIFAEAVRSFGPVYCDGPADTTTKRLFSPLPAEAGGIPGLAPGALLDDGANRALRPWFTVPGMRPLLLYGERLPYHRALPSDAIPAEGDPGLYTVGENLMMCSFELHDFRRARFVPSKNWDTLISFIAAWLTGARPAALPAPTVRFGVSADLHDDAAFDRCRKEAVARGMDWLRRNLVDGGSGGIREGLRHNISPEGVQTPALTVRTDCTGEAAGAFRFYGALTGDREALSIADALADVVFGPMTVTGGPFDGMLRWTDEGWEVCYQDDAARAVLPALYECYYLKKTDRLPAVCRALDFLVRTTAKDGCRAARTDAPFLDAAGLASLREAKHGLPSAHYNAYYHASLLLAYLCGGNETYLATARRGLETLMSLYPDTRREQSETEETCRLILPLALLYKATGEEAHRAMLYRVTGDLARLRHPKGGYREWDTGYKAACARTAAGECSLLTENGDPVADLLYSVNWLPVGFATAWRVTGDAYFYGLWRDIAAFCISSQMHADDPAQDGAWCRAFDLELGEACGCPHDAGWGPLCSESGWTDAEILMGLMLPDIFAMEDLEKNTGRAK